jgi:hypothetical protein
MVLKVKELLRMKKILTVLAVAGIVAGTAFSVGTHVMADTSRNPSNIIGVWNVTAVAPYAPHLFTFNADGTMLSTNPTNVQESSGKPHGGTNDSVGMGVWRVQEIHGDRYIVGNFEELNALADTHQPTDTLSVSFKVQLTNNGNGFDGPASATVGNETDPSHLTGTRLSIDQDAVNQLN